MARRAGTLVVILVALLVMCACSSEYERDTASWSALQTFLSREPETTLVPLRHAVQISPKILYYTTAYRMTWLFFDNEHKLRDYYLSSQ
jgi:hypothetical protein